MKWITQQRWFEKHCLEGSCTEKLSRIFISIFLQEQNNTTNLKTKTEIYLRKKTKKCPLKED